MSPFNFFMSLLFGMVGPFVLLAFCFAYQVPKGELWPVAAVAALFVIALYFNFRKDPQ